MIKPPKDLNKHFNCKNCKEIKKHTAINGFMCFGHPKRYYRRDYYRMCLWRSNMSDKHALDFNIEEIYLIWRNFGKMIESGYKPIKRNKAAKKGNRTLKTSKIKGV